MDDDIRIGRISPYPSKIDPRRPRSEDDETSEDRDKDKNERGPEPDADPEIMDGHIDTRVSTVETGE